MDQTLRQRAEIVLQKTSHKAGQAETKPAATSALALQELYLYQIELEMQNEDLRRSQDAVQLADERFFDFYDMAPVGYCTVSDSGQILQANLTTASMLGVPRVALE
ncbi:MAG: diguanylate cyclase, partial [Rhodoferax sp.]|nr:diguanylate cyclase [Rhodoferax sp.]